MIKVKSRTTHYSQFHCDIKKSTWHIRLFWIVEKSLKMMNIPVDLWLQETKNMKTHGTAKTLLAIGWSSTYWTLTKERVRLILHDELNMKKVFAKMILKNLTQEQKNNWKIIRSDNMERLTVEPKLVTEKTWILKFDKDTKLQSMHSVTPLFQEWKKWCFYDGMDTWGSDR